MKTDELTLQEKKYLLSEKRRTGKSMEQCLENFRMPKIALLDHDAPRPEDFKEKDICLRRRKY